MCEEVMIGFHLTSDWLRKQCKIFLVSHKTLQCKTKAKLHLFDTHLKITLYFLLIQCVLVNIEPA